MSVSSATGKRRGRFGAIAGALCGVAIGVAPLMILDATARTFDVTLQTTAPPTAGPKLDHAFKPVAGAPFMGPQLAAVSAENFKRPPAEPIPAPGESSLGTISMARTSTGGVYFAAPRPTPDTDVEAPTVETASVAEPPRAVQPAASASVGVSALAPLSADQAPPSTSALSGAPLGQPVAALPARPSQTASTQRIAGAETPIAMPPDRAWASYQDAAGRDAAASTKAFTGDAGFVLIDIAGGKVLERRKADGAFIPASVSKVPTALYAYETLGPDFRFVTEVFANGPVAGGVLKGDLYLVGSGDPTLDTGDLAALAQQLADRGVRQVTGRFIYVAGPAPATEMLDPTQPLDAAYNPAISGLNLNFNRVLFKWSRNKSGGFDIEMNAHAARKSIAAPSVRAEVAAQGGTKRVFHHRWEGETNEVWTVSPSILGRRGSRWLPVRRPAYYAASTFRALAAEAGVDMPEPSPGVAIIGQPTLLARHESDPLAQIIKGMMRFSTNLTAEMLGMASSAARGLDSPTFATSAAVMGDWTAKRYAVGLGGRLDMARDGAVAGETSTLLNHSGLATRSRMTPREAAALVARLAAQPEGYAVVERIFPEYKVRGLKGASVLAKTGTMYFGRALNGYLNCDGGRRFAFAIFGSDIARRVAFDKTFDPRTNAKPNGGERWLNRARTFERTLLKDWTERFC